MPGPPPLPVPGKRLPFASGASQLLHVQADAPAAWRLFALVHALPPVVVIVATAIAATIAFDVQQPFRDTIVMAAPVVGLFIAGATSGWMAQRLWGWKAIQWRAGGAGAERRPPKAKPRMAGFWLKKRDRDGWATDIQAALAVEMGPWPWQPPNPPSAESDAAYDTAHRRHRPLRRRIRVIDAHGAVATIAGLALVRLIPITWTLAALVSLIAIISAVRAWYIVRLLDVWANWYRNAVLDYEAPRPTMSAR